MFELPKNEKTFKVDITGEVSFNKWQGDFTVACVLNIGQKHQIEVEKTRLIADLSNPTEKLLGLSVIISNLLVRIKEAPKWWDMASGLDLLDENVALEVFDQCMKAEREWKDSVKKLANPPQKESSEKDKSEE